MILETLKVGRVNLVVDCESNMETVLLVVCWKSS